MAIKREHLDAGRVDLSALRLARYFGTSAELWVNLQVHCDLAVAKFSSRRRIVREVEPHVA